MVTRIVFSMVGLMPRRQLLLAAACAVLLAGCGSGGGDDGRPLVVATTTQAADLARDVAGDRARVRGVLAPNSDPHDYEVRPGDVKALARARLVVRSGGDLDEWLGGAIDSAGADAPVLDLLGVTGAEGDDPLGYYARRYGLRVVGTVIPSLSTQAQASSGDLAELVDTIRRERVRAIFAESSVNASVEDAIAQETGARVGRPLWADSLGPPGSSGATYEGSVRANTSAIVEGLSGGASTCSFPR